MPRLEYFAEKRNPEIPTVKLRFPSRDMYAEKVHAGVAVEIFRSFPLVTRGDAGRQQDGGWYRKERLAQSWSIPCRMPSSPQGRVQTVVSSLAQVSMDLCAARPCLSVPSLPFPPPNLHFDPRQGGTTSSCRRSFAPSHLPTASLPAFLLPYDMEITTSPKHRP